MLIILQAAGARPCGVEARACTLRALLGPGGVVSVAVLAEAFKIVGTVNWDLVELQTLALGVFAVDFLGKLGLRVLMVFEPVVTETLGGSQILLQETQIRNP